MLHPAQKNAEHATDSKVIRGREESNNHRLNFSVTHNLRSLAKKAALSECSCGASNARSPGSAPVSLRGRNKGLSFLFRSYRQVNVKGCPAAGGGFEVELGADQRRALFHSGQAQPLRALFLVSQTKSASVVADYHHYRVAAVLQNYLDALCTGMLVGVVQRFLNYPVKICFHIGRKAGVFPTGSENLRLHARVLRPLAAVVLYRLGQADVLQKCGPQFPGEKINTVVYLRHDNADLLDRLARFRILRTRLCPLHNEAQSDQLLPQLVMKIPRDAASFIFLCDDQTLQNVLVAARFFGQAACGQISGDR